MTARMPTALARKDFAAVVRRSQRGERIKVTRHNKTAAVVISKEDLEHLESCEERRNAGQRQRK